MKPIFMYLDEAIEKGAARNDSDIASKLGVSRACISDWRRGKNAPSDEQAIALAELIGKPVIELMAEAAAHRAKTAKSRAYWEQIAKYSATFASVMVAFVITLANLITTPEARASNGMQLVQKFDNVQIIISRLFRKSLIYIREIKTALIDIILENGSPIWTSRIN